VLKALGVDDELAHSSLRFGVGRFNTAAEIEFAIEEVARNVTRLRAMNPVVRST
jgi:cysteine desulfurase